MNGRYIICSVFVSCLFFSCQKSNNSQNKFTQQLYDKKLTDSLHNRALDHGDTLAYRELRMIYYLGGPRTTDFLCFALVMSNKYNFKEAADDVYFLLNESDSILDDKTQEMANYYLARSKSQ